MDDPQTYFKNASNETSFKRQLKTKGLWSDFNDNLNYKDDPWIISNVMKYKINNENLNLPKPIYVLSSFEMTKDVYFYEIEILHNFYNKPIHFGLTTKFLDLENYLCIENKCPKNSCLIFQNDYFLSGDIIGCLVNLEKQKITVYINGNLVLVNKNTNIFENLPIFALTLVKFGQKIRMNFGNTTFKYPPCNKYYETFHSMTIQKFPSFQIKVKNNIKWLCRKDLDEKIKLKVFDYDKNNLEICCRFSDLKQKQLNNEIIDIVTKINNGEDSKTIQKIICFIFKNVEYDDFDCYDLLVKYRFLQSIAEIEGYKIETNKINKLDLYILNSLKYFKFAGGYHVFLHEYIFIFFKTIDFKTIDYKNKTKLHYVCLILFNFIEENNCCIYLKEKCYLIFQTVLQHSTDFWSLLYSFKGLKKYINHPLKANERYLLALNNYIKESIFKNTTLFYNLKNFIEEIASKNTRVKENSAKLQLYQYLLYFLPEISKTIKNMPQHRHHIVFLTGLTIEVPSIEFFIFSFSNLMVRNEFLIIRSIRYKFLIKPPTFYFEVTIITAGSMRIGLAAKQMDIQDDVGENALSIGIDGYERCVWMHRKAYKFKTSRPKWDAGDVIGIYVDFANRSVIFGINSKIIEIDGDPFEEEFIFSILPCHVAASLEKNQQCFFNFDCTVVPKAFLNKLKAINLNIQDVNNSVFMFNSTASTGSISINDMSNQLNNMQTLNYDWQLNFIMKSDETAKKSLQTWSTVTEEINHAYGRVLSERYKKDKQITLSACKQWHNQLESVLKDIRNPEHSYDKYMRKIGEIYRKLKSDAQKPNPEPNPHNQPLMLMPAPVQLGQSNFSLWLNSLMMALISEGAVQAVTFPLQDEHPHNLIARGRILLTVPVQLQAPIEQLKVAYEMLQVLRYKYEKNDEFSQSSTANVSRKRALPFFDESGPETSVKQSQNQPSTSWAP